MNRFSKSSRPHLRLPGILLSALVCVGAVLIMQAGLDSLSQSTQSERIHSLEKAVRRATVQCYALEGQYPPNLSYLEEHYGVLVDHSRFVVHFESVAENLMPEIKVFPISGGGDVQ